MNHVYLLTFGKNVSISDGFIMFLTALLIVKKLKYLIRLNQILENFCTKKIGHLIGLESRR